MLLTGPLRVLKMRFPEAILDVAVTAAAMPLLAHLSFINRVFSLEASTSESPNETPEKIFDSAIAAGYDLVLVFHGSLSTAWKGRQLKRRGGVCIVNHHELGQTFSSFLVRRILSSLPVPNQGLLKANIDRDLDLLRAISLEVSLAEAMPELSVSQEEVMRAQQMLLQSGPSQNSMYIFLGIGASRETKRWPVTHFLELAKGLLKAYPNVHFVISTLGAESAMGIELMALFKRNIGEMISHFQDLSLRETMSLIFQCRAYIGNDSGLKHVAVGLGISTLTFFGPEDPLEWHPYSQSEHPYLFLNALACRTLNGKHWCAIPVCHSYGHQCMKNLAPEMALEKALTILTNHHRVNA